MQEDDETTVTSISNKQHNKQKAPPPHPSPDHHTTTTNLASSSTYALQEWEYAKVRQDAQLERIERGIGTLGDMARGMQEELDKQNPVVDDIDTQLSKVTGQLKTNNAKLTGLITQVRVE